MKTSLGNILQILAALMLFGPCLHAEESVIARARVFNLPQKDADALMALPDFYTDPHGMLARIESMVGRREAEAMGSPSLQLRVGASAIGGGLVKMGVEVKKMGGDFDVFTRVEYKEEALQTMNIMKRGGMTFLGSFDRKPGLMERRTRS
jgi:hypothetical protein